MIAIGGTPSAISVPSIDSGAGGAVQRAEFKQALARAAAVEKAAPSTATQGASRVRAERTQLSGEQAADAITSAWSDAVGEAPSKGTLSILTAHWAHETGQGSAMYNFNFAGIKGTSPEGLSASYRTSEGWGPTQRRTVDQFRAYSSARAGASDYLRLLTTRYPEAIAAAKNEDPAAFVDALKSKGYFTGDRVAYLKNVTRLANQAMASGFDALGGTRGAIERAAVPEADYFSLPTDLVRAAKTSDVSSLRPEDLPAMAQSLSAYTFADEISRAALRLALDSSSHDE
jgi:flagellum-specific peptidoglycan hydrolase FlgJ